MTPFEQSVLKIVRMIPPGKVMSYGQVALCIGSPRAAREVGWTMHNLGGEPDFPWWRVLNNKGYISIKNGFGDMAATQQKLLEAEGVEFTDDYTLDIERYRYHPTDTTHQASLWEAKSAKKLPTT
jgi:methylated-DNA-protein-cysteine methyltransferase-like protein